MNLFSLPALAILALAAAALARWPARAPDLGRISRVLDHPGTPWAVGAATFLIQLAAWGSLTPVPLYHDEAAYLLQAEIFAMGRAAGPGTPLPEFFEQFHVLVTPRLSPKYPPGFALGMVPGIWLHLPALMPLLFTAVTGGLLYGLSRRMAGGVIALLAWVLWVSAPANLIMRSGFFSQTLTGALWLGGWWALLAWRRDQRTLHLVLVGLLVGWCAITRPLTAIVFAVPAGILVLREVHARRAWRALGLALAAGTAVLSALPIHNRLVTGQWARLPYAEYTATYLPFDRMGFGFEPVEPMRPLPPDMLTFARFFAGVHAAHQLDSLPRIALARGAAILSGTSNRAPLTLAGLALAGLVGAPGAVIFAAGTSLLLPVSHLAYAHTADWILYYLETLPVLALLAALGIGWLVDQAGRLAASEGSAPVSGQLQAALVVAVLWAGALLPGRLGGAAGVLRQMARGQAHFRQVISSLPGRSIVFVRYGPRHIVHFSLIANPPDYALASAWVVYDRGADNRRLTTIAPDRAAYLYLEEEHRLVPLPATSGPTGVPAPTP